MKRASILLVAFLFACSSSPKAPAPDAQAKAEKAYQSGLTKANAGRAIEAEAYFREAIVLKSDYLPGHLGLGALFAHSGKTKEALDVYKNALKQVGEKAEIYEDLAFVYSQADDKAKTLESLKKAIALREQLPSSADNQKWILQNKKAIEELSK